MCFSLQRESSIMTVDGETITGGAAIVDKISKFIGCTFEVQTVRIMHPSARCTLRTHGLCNICRPTFCPPPLMAACSSPSWVVLSACLGSPTPCCSHGMYSLCAHACTPPAHRAVRLQRDDGDLRPERPALGQRHVPHELLLNLHAERATALCV